VQWFGLALALVGIYIVVGLKPANKSNDSSEAK
jgi:cytochrome oxidase assembly protein ShyY1